MKTEVFEKVYVHTGDDLPKKDGEYITKTEGQCNPAMSVFEVGNTLMVDHWIKLIIWYLRPVLPKDGIKESRLTGEQITDKAKDYMKSKGFTRENNIIGGAFHDAIEELLTGFASELLALHGADEEELGKFFDFVQVMRDTYSLTEKSLVINKYLQINENNRQNYPTETDNEIS